MTEASNDVNSPHGQHAVVEGYDLREYGIWECALVESISAWGSMHKNTLHQHEGQMELCYLSLGRRVYVDQQRTCVMHAGNVWCNAPDVLHSSIGRQSASARFYCMDLLPPKAGKIWCGLPYATAKKAWDALLTLDPVKQSVAVPWLQPCYDRLYELLRSDAGLPGRDMAVAMAFNALVANFIAGVVLPPKPPEGAERVRYLIERINGSAATDVLIVQKLVKEVGVSASYFVNAFRQIVGQTPGQYILSRRLEAAARCIAAGESIKQVSATYNFDSTQHFTRAFHKYFLETPNRYYLRVKAERDAVDRAIVTTRNVKNHK